MSNHRLKRDIAKAVGRLCTATEATDEWIVPLGAHTPAGRNHFVLFLKPELLAVRTAARLGAILDLVLDALHHYGAEIGAVRALNGPYLARHRIMEEHYGVINRASRLGMAALSAATRNRLETEHPEVRAVLGAHQLLERYPEISPFALNIVVDTIGSQKIAGGKYATVLNIEGEKVAVLNGFHPQQLLHYTRPGRALVIFECASEADWKDLRHGMTGVTNPANAAEGSIRRTLREHARDLGLPEVTTATNGVHCSAGPLEAMLEYCRFFSDHTGKALVHPGATPFGQLLRTHGLRQKEITALAKNPLIGDGKAADYVFNRTEEKNAGAAAELLAKAARETT